MKAIKPLLFPNTVPPLGAGVGTTPKQVLHRTGLPWVGLNGTVVSLPQLEQLTCVSSRTRPLPARLALQGLQCLGRLVNPPPWKNCCSPAENTNSTPHVSHLRSLSANSI